LSASSVLGAAATASGDAAFASTGMRRAGAACLAEAWRRPACPPAVEQAEVQLQVEACMLCTTALWTGRSRCTAETDAAANLAERV
jgi:hypothetical protein